MITQVPPSEVERERSKSVLFDVCRLASELQAISDKEQKWKMISKCMGGDACLCSLPLQRKSSCSAAETGRRTSHPCLASDGTFWYKWTIPNITGSCKSQASRKIICGSTWMYHAELKFAFVSCAGLFPYYSFPLNVGKYQLMLLLSAI